LRVGDAGTLNGVFDELRRDTNLGADVAELSRYAEEELVLLAHGLVHVAGQAGALFGLKSHVGVCDFGDGREEKNDGEEEDESCDAEVGPLDARQVFGLGVFEEDTGSEERRHDRADGLEGLGELKTKF